MKRFTLLALGVIAMASSAMAADMTTYVTNKTEFENALKACAGMTADDSHTIIISKKLTDDKTAEAEVADNSVVINGNFTFSHNTGKLVIKSNQTDINNLPQLQAGLNGKNHTADSKFSLFIENVSLQYRSGNTATSGQVLYWQKMRAEEMQIDTIAFRNCDITNIPRTIFRTAPKTKDENGNPIEITAPSKLKYLEMTGCKVHDMNITNGNNWALFVLGSMPVEVNFHDNMFYDLPYTKGIIQMAYVPTDGTAPRIMFYNNTVMMAKATYTIDGAEKNNQCTLFAMGDYLDASTEYYIYNNLFLTPKAGKRAPATITDSQNFTYVEGGTDILSARKIEEGVTTQLGYLTAHNNLTDESFASMDRGYDMDEIGTELAAESFDWSAFYKADVSNFLVEKSNKFYTMGATAINNLEGTPIVEIPSCVGANSVMYVDEFPKEAKVNVAVAGSKSVSVSILPEKETYMVGDEITITLNDHNSYYRTFNTFKGWSDGSMETVRKITLESTDGINLTATYEEADGIVAAFDFSKVNDNMKEYVADLGAQAGVAKVYVMAADTAGMEGAIATAAVPYVAGKTFQTRAGKFGEDPVEMQMPIISRRTAKNVRDFNRDYAVVEFSTKSISDVTVDYFVGTDNNASKIQKAFYSLDGENYTDLNADSTLVNGKWCNVKFLLPAEAAGQEKVYVKIQGQVNNGDKAENITYTDVAGAFDPSNLYNYDVFEYIGNILIKGNIVNTANLEAAIKVANDTLAYVTEKEANAYLVKAIATANEELNSAAKTQATVDAATTALNKAVTETFVMQRINSLTALVVTAAKPVYYMTPEDAAGYIADKWFTVENGGTPASMTKKGTIDPETDATISAKNFAGITIKNNGGKIHYMKVTSVASAKFYVCTDKDMQREATFSIYGTTESKGTGLVAKNTSGVVEFTGLNPAQTYVFKAEATGDMDFYAAKFTYGDPTGVAEVENADAANASKVFKTFKNGSVIIVKGDAEYSATGAQMK